MPDRGDHTTVTLKTIAEELGVSITTVTRALKGGPKISEGTIRRVRETAERLGYVRNLDGVKLRTGQTFVIMALLGFNNDEEIGDPSSVGLLNGMYMRLSGTPFTVRAIPTTIGDSGLEFVENVVRGRNADGLILDHTEPDDPRVRFLIENDVPFVTFGRTDSPQEHAFLDVDNEMAAYRETTLLIRAGHKRIALLDASPDFQFVRQRLEGYRRAFAEHGMEVDQNLIAHLSMEVDTVGRKAAELAVRGADAFVCMNELFFLAARAGVMRAMGREGLKIGFTVRSGTNIADYVGTPVYASFYSRQKAGWQLADFLLRRIDGASPESCQMIVQTELRFHEGFLK